MGVYKIQIAPGVYDEIKKQLEKMTYVSKQEAIDSLTRAFEHEKIKFIVRDDGDKKVFLNQSGGEMAAVIPV
jgi:uncharacterized protein YjgD (DUF1641 family)